jgi:dGTPase
MLDLAREHADPLAEGQDPLTVDRQRVVHAAAFRRLQHKTQVFVAPESDHFRSRLTHTLEVAHLARGLADALHLDAALAEVVALAHDLGHPPFGHAGETALAACLADHGGFEHNQHTLRVVEWLEHPYPEFRGLNLTRAVRACLARHSTPYDRPGPHPLQDGRPAPPESAVVDLADRLTYALHDLQDGLYAGLVEPASLNALGLWQATYAGPALDAPDAWHGHLRPAVDRMQRRVLAPVARHFAAGGTMGSPWRWTHS